MPRPAHRLEMEREPDAARAACWEDPAGSPATALRRYEAARGRGHAAPQVRALALRGAILLHRGDLHGALAAATEAERVNAESAVVRCEPAGLRAQLALSGSASTRPSAPGAIGSSPSRADARRRRVLVVRRDARHHAGGALLDA